VIEQLLKYNQAFKFLTIALLLCVFVVGTHETSFAQSNELSHVDDGDAKKEEIQRYIGYEDLLFRYLSLPYDSSVNVNLTANFVDIGFLYLMFLPLIFVILIRHRSKTLAIIVSLLCISMLLIATSNSYIYNPKTGQGVKTDGGQIMQQFPEDFSTIPVATAVSKMYKVTTKMFTPFKKIGDYITGQSDHFTYPFLLLLFVFTGFYMYTFLKDRKSNTLITVGFLFFNYSFFWLVLSSGIIWYGFLMLSLGFALIILMLKKLKEREPFHYKWVNTAFISMAIIWIVMSFVLRVGNINAGTHPSLRGVGPFHPILYDYSSGAKTEKQVLNRLYPGFYDTVNKINRDPKTKIYQVGTSFTYFFKNNHKRVQVDNQLGLYNALTERYPDKNELVDVFKASGFKYIIIDFNTVTIDKTDSRSLSQKYSSFMNFIKDNPRTKLINTNRIVEVNDPNTGQANRYYAIFGRQIFAGSYAILELN